MLNFRRMLEATIDDGAQQFGTKHQITEAAAVDRRVVTLKMNALVG
jgi:hypothetical protein